MAWHCILLFVFIPVPLRYDGVSQGALPTGRQAYNKKKMQCFRHSAIS